MIDCQLFNLAYLDFVKLMQTQVIDVCVQKDQRIIEYKWGGWGISYLAKCVVPGLVSWWPRKLCDKEGNSEGMEPVEQAL